MPTPLTELLRVARGTYSNLNSSVLIFRRRDCLRYRSRQALCKRRVKLVSTQAALPATNAVTDAAQTFTAGQRGEITVLTDAAYPTIDLGSSNNFVLTFTSTIGNTREMPNPSGTISPGQSGSIFLVQDGTGSRTITWGSYWDFVGGTAPTLSTAANAVDRIDYIVRTATSIHAVFTGNYS